MATYLDYMREHTDEGLDWCEVYCDDANGFGDYYLVRCNGLVESIKTPDGVVHRYGGENFDTALREFAKTVNPDYDYYRGYNDFQIASDKLHRVGCWHCPFKGECEAMMEEPEGE